MCVYTTREFHSIKLNFRRDKETCMRKRHEIFSLFPAIKKGIKLFLLTLTSVAYLTLALLFNNKEIIKSAKAYRQNSEVYSLEICAVASFMISTCRMKRECH